MNEQLEGQICTAGAQEYTPAIILMHVCHGYVPNTRWLTAKLQVGAQGSQEHKFSKTYASLIAFYS